MEGNYRHPNPSKQEINTVCERIREGWSPATYKSRWQGPTVPWTVPIISIKDIRSAAKDESEEMNNI